MDVIINGTPKSVANDATVEEVLDSLLVDRPSLGGVAVAINEEVLPRSGWDTATLSEGDRVEILTARQGG